MKIAFALADAYAKIGDLQANGKAREFHEKSDRLWTKYQQAYTLLPAEIEKMQAVRKKLQEN